jgi:hypothetical protein
MRPARWRWNAARAGFRLFIDGKPVLESGVPATVGFTKEVWPTDGSSSLLVLARDNAAFERFSIRPSSGTTLATMLGGQCSSFG